MILALCTPELEREYLRALICAHNPPGDSDSKSTGTLVEPLRWLLNDRVNKKAKVQALQSELEAERKAHTDTQKKLAESEECGLAMSAELEYERDTSADLLRTVEELRKDEERLDTLSSLQYAGFGTNYHDGQWCVQLETRGYAERGLTLREAIDKI